VFNAESLRAFYLKNSSNEQSIFHIWEEGGAKGDSITPSTYSRSYRVWMSDLLRKFLTERGAETPGLISVGCGNAAVEAALVRQGYRVIGVDALEVPVELARAKGVDAVCADVFTWTPPPGPWDVVYADGVFGHLYDPDKGVQHAMERFRSWLPEGAGAIVVSNDGPRTDDDIEPHPDVPGFVWLSRSYLHDQVEAAGFHDVSSTHFTYERPLSGRRDRVIVTGRA
jgi:SAM-dependent methyltransferase